MNSLESLLSQVRAAGEDGFEVIWFPQRMSVDALVGLAVASREVPTIKLGIAVVPIQGRHPIPLAQQILTVAAAAGADRVTVGLGVAHPQSSDERFGVPYSTVVDLCAEQLEVLTALMSDQRRADFEGTHLTARVNLDLAGAPPGIVLAALGPRMLELAGRWTDGTVTWMTGARSLQKAVVPHLHDAAGRAGRGAPRVVVGLPTCVTDDVGSIERAFEPQAARMAAYPTYSRMLRIEEVARPVDVCVFGNEDAVSERLLQLREAGATEFVAHVVGDQEAQARTRRFLTTAQV